MALYAHQLSDASFYLTLSFHHAILDGWSVATLLAELFALYTSGQPESERSLLPAPRLAYRDFVAVEQAALDDAEVEQFWDQQLADIVPTQLPRDPELPTEAGPGTLAVEERTLRDDLAERLESLSRRLGVPLKNLLLAAHVRVLALATGQDQITTGLVVNGRPEEEGGDRLLGLFLNTLPVNVTVEGSWRELIQSAVQAERDLLPGRRYPIARLQQRYGGQTLFETAFNYNHFHVYDQLDRVESITIDEPTVFEYTNFPLMANFERENVGDRQTRLRLRLNYDSARWTARGCTNWLKAICASSRHSSMPPTHRYMTRTCSGLSSASW